ncbi:hypothetical protein AAFF_G00036460 [Aldrovandia affinis]|uniref:Uncharacterized protein n=1 Tax=Aldrovandia affinis TaxID=143900 RepID=A0AAD7WFY5_9TELE|nr:hypothetical protein AAFF_G00036460 [Aldrovandia affinis]
MLSLRPPVPQLPSIRWGSGPQDPSIWSHSPLWPPRGVSEVPCEQPLPHWGGVRSSCGQGGGVGHCPGRVDHCQGHSCGSEMPSPPDGLVILPGSQPL